MALDRLWSTGRAFLSCITYILLQNQITFWTFDTLSSILDVCNNFWKMMALYFWTLREWIRPLGVLRTGTGLLQNNRQLARQAGRSNSYLKTTFKEDDPFSDWVSSTLGQPPQIPYKTQLCHLPCFRTHEPLSHLWLSFFQIDFL